MAKDTLTQKEHEFLLALLEGCSQREAYKRAYNAERMSDATIDVTASRLLKKPKIALRYEQLKNRVIREAEEEAIVSSKRVLKEIAKMAFFDVRKLFDEDGRPLSITELDDDTAAAVAGLEVNDVYAGEDREFIGYVKKYKLADKKGNLELLARHLGLLNDKLNVTGTLNNPAASLTEEELRRLAAIDDESG